MQFEVPAEADDETEEEEEEEEEEEGRGAGGDGLGLRQLEFIFAGFEGEMGPLRPLPVLTRGGCKEREKRRKGRDIGSGKGGHRPSGRYISTSVISDHNV